MYDVIIIGGSYAGLAAALQLARARRNILVLDAGQRRNRFAAHSHGFLGQDGQPPDAIAAKGRSEVLAYPTVSWRESLASEALAVAGGFAVRAGTERYLGRRLILATGMVDEVPAVPGLAEQWGKTAFLCPYCDGYELNMPALGVLATCTASPHFAVIVSEWSAPGQTTLFLNGAPLPEPAQLAELSAHSINIEPEPVLRAADGAPGMTLHLRDGRQAKMGALFLLPRTRFTTAFAEQLGCQVEEGPLGPMYKTDDSKETTVPGVFACGDAALSKPSVAFAVADGVRAGGAAHQSLLFRPTPKLG